jgi:hypothetical protein
MRGAALSGCRVAFTGVLPTHAEDTTVRASSACVPPYGIFRMSFTGCSRRTWRIYGEKSPLFLHVSLRIVSAAPRLRYLPRGLHWGAADVRRG